MTKNIKEMIDKYDDSAVSTVEALEHIRLKPSMYLGSTATPYHALIEIINNSVDEAVIGVADKIDVIIHKDGSLSVEDNGRGLPVNYSTKFKGITSRALLTKTNTGKAFGSGGSSGTSQNGVGGKANLATSDWLKMEVYRDGYKYSDSFATIDGKPGIPTTDLVKNELPKVKLPKEDKEKHGTKLHWLPSIDVWDSINIDTEELKEVLKKEQPIAYTGYEPSGKIHLGHAVTVQKLKTLQKLGFKIKILLADFHAFLNGKGSIEEIAETAEYNMKCFKALGLDETTEFILGSSFQLNEDYASKVYKLATLTTLKRARRSMDQVSRHDDNPKVASVVYPIMQTVDMVALDVDVALGGMEQRKIQMLARENLEKIDEKVPVCIHTPLLHGLDGDAKMSSSKGNYIAVDDSVEEITKKIKKSYCPQGETEGNPMIEIAETFVYPNQETLLIKRPEKFGGDIELTHEQLINDFSNGDLHPMDLKNGIKDFLIEHFAPVREYMEE